MYSTLYDKAWIWSRIRILGLEIEGWFSDFIRKAQSLIFIHPRFVCSVACASATEQNRTEQKAVQLFYSILVFTFHTFTFTFTFTFAYSLSCSSTESSIKVPFEFDDILQWFPGQFWNLEPLTNELRRTACNLKRVGNLSDRPSPVEEQEQEQEQEQGVRIVGSHDGLRAQSWP